MNKIIYFDKETIQNILQEQNKGSLNKKVDLSTTAQLNSEIEVATKIDLGVPFWDRLRFLFSGGLSLSYIANKNSTTTISSTEISEFEKIKKNLIKNKNIQVVDIENSSTFFRVAANYLKMMKGGVKGVDVKEFKAVMDGFDGYDTYKIDKNNYVRFNNSAFVSNYKRNDLLITKMTIYSIPVGKFTKDDFDFYRQVLKMETLITNVQPEQMISDVFPSSSLGEMNYEEYTEESKDSDEVKLYEAVYACIEVEELNA